MLAFLGELALRALLLGIMGFVAAWAVRRRGAEAQHAIWRIVLTGMLALPLLIGIVPPFSILPARQPISIVSKALPTMPERPSVVSFAPAVPIPVPSLQPLPHPASSINWRPLALFFYVAVAVLLFGRVMLSFLRGKKAAASATRITIGLADELAYPRPELRESAQIAVPFTLGRRDPLIVLPTSWREWDDFKLRSVLSHELAHIRRNDWTTALAAAINRSLFWFHPLAWWLEKRLAALAEEACDAAAIRSAEDAPRYARVVLDFAELASMGQVLGATSMARTSKVGRRISGILERRVDLNRPMNSVAWLLVLAIALPAIFAAASFQLFAKPQAQELPKSPTSIYSSMIRIDAVRAVLADGWKLTADEAAKLESGLVRDPENLTARIRLLSYYTQYIISPELRSAHLLWLIDHHPDSDVFLLQTVATGSVPDYSSWNSPSIARVNALWLQQTERYPTNTKVLANAATALGGPAALELVRRARIAEPNNPEWVDWLAQVYALAVRTSNAVGIPRVHAGSGALSRHYAFALPLADSQMLKSEIEGSTDAALVSATAKELIRETALITGPVSRDAEVQSSEAFGKQLLLRAQQLTTNP